MHGAVEDIFRYPIKSLRGERLARAEVAAGGLAGDRALALLDQESGRIASAKEPRSWGSLLQLRASYAANERDLARGSVTVDFPDGRTLRGDDEQLVQALSRWTGRSVTLVREAPGDARIARVTPEGEDGAGSCVEVPIGKGAPPGSLVDFAPLHLITTASLRALAAAHPHDGGDHVARFRPNLVLALDGAEGFEESRWPAGQLLRIGQVVLRVLCASPRCCVPTLAQGDGVAADRDVVRTLSAHNRVAVAGLGSRACLGVYASVVRGGSIAVGDAIALD